MEILGISEPSTVSDSQDVTAPRVEIFREATMEAGLFPAGITGGKSPSFFSMESLGNNNAGCEKWRDPYGLMVMVYEIIPIFLWVEGSIPFQGTNISPSQGMFESMMFWFSKVGNVSSVDGIITYRILSKDENPVFFSQGRRRIFSMIDVCQCVFLVQKRIVLN